MLLLGGDFTHWMGCSQGLFTLSDVTERDKVCWPAVGAGEKPGSRSRGHAALQMNYEAGLSVHVGGGDRNRQFINF